MNPLLSVEAAWSFLQQEKTHREVLELGNVDLKPISLCSRQQATVRMCSQCGNKGHPKERCWAIKGYPSWHFKIKNLPKKKEIDFRTTKPRSLETKDLLQMLIQLTKRLERQSNNFSALKQLQ